MFKKGTKLYSILNNKCPRCNEGDFYTLSGFFKLKKTTEMHTNCSNCNLKYMVEPSFFVGAMYVNYGLTVAVAIVTFIISKVILGLTINQSFAAIVVALILFIPVGLRMSRLIWINIFVAFEKKIKK